MPEFSHEDIKNAILHIGETSEQVPATLEATTLPTADTVEVEVPGTPYEGFVGSEPSEEERVGFLAAKDQVQTRHRNRTILPNTQPNHTMNRNRTAAVAAGTTAAVVLAAIGVYAAFRGHEDGTDTPDATPSVSGSATPGETPKPVETVKDYEVTKTQYPTAEAAATQLVVLENEYLGSAEPNPVILEAVLGEDIHATPQTSTLANVMEEARVAIQTAMHNMKVGNNKEGEFSLTFESDGSSDAGQMTTPNTSYSVDGMAHYSSNYDEPPYYNDNFDWDQPYTLTLSYDESGAWHLTDQIQTGERIPTASSE